MSSRGNLELVRHAEAARVNTLKAVADLGAVTVGTADRVIEPIVGTAVNSGEAVISMVKDTSEKVTEFAKDRYEAIEESPQMGKILRFMRRASRSAREVRKGFTTTWRENEEQGKKILGMEEPRKRRTASKTAPKGSSGKTAARPKASTSSKRTAAAKRTTASSGKSQPKRSTAKARVNKPGAKKSTSRRR